MLNQLINMIKRGRVSRNDNDGDKLPIQQATFMGDTSDFMPIFGYGHHANLPKDALLTLFTVNGQEQNMAGIGELPEQRIKNLKPGEVVFYHPITKAKIHFKENGDIDLDAGTANVNVKANNVNIDAAQTNLGVGGPALARVGDTVEVVVTGGSSAGTYQGTITTGGDNTSI